MVSTRLAAALLALGLSGPVLAAQSLPSRDEALKSITAPDVGQRRQAVAGLSESGLFADAPVLVKALRDPDPITRGLAQHGLWRLWSRSGDKEVDALLQRGVEEMGEGPMAAAIATFTQVIERRPDFAEGWNKRATAYYLAGDYEKSLKDCDEVLKRNPAHFGALSGYGQIYVRLNQPEKALDYFRRAYAINPNLDGVSDAIEGLERVLRRKAQRMI